MATEQEYQAERDARLAAERRADDLDRAGRLRDAIDARGFTGERAEALRRLVDPAAEDLDAAVAAAVTEHPAIFAPAAPAPGPRRSRRMGPANPHVPTPSDGRPGDYLDPSVYARMPQAERLSPVIQDRLQRSRPWWPGLRGRDLPLAE